MKLKTEDKLIFEEGKNTHHRIQQHVSNKKRDKIVEKIIELPEFPIVETRDFDPKTTFEFNISDERLKEKYQIFGFADGLNRKEKMGLEIKSSRNSLWGLSKFQQSPQRKLYAMGFPWMEKQVLITCLHDIKTAQDIKKYTVNVSENDRREGKEWIVERLLLFEQLLQSGDFSGGLDEEGRCNGWCYYGRNCYFYDPSANQKQPETDILEY